MMDSENKPIIIDFDSAKPIGERLVKGGKMNGGWKTQGSLRQRMISMAWRKPEKFFSRSRKMMRCVPSIDIFAFLF